MKYLKNYLLYIISVICLFIFLSVSIYMFKSRANVLSQRFYNKLNKFENIEDGNIKYPNFDVKEIDSEIEKIVNIYKKEKNVEVSYTTYVTEDILNTFFIIKDNGVTSYKNLNFDIKTREFVSNNQVFDFNSMGSLVLDKVKSKYSSNVYNIISADNFKNAYVSVSDNGVSIYFDPRLFNNLEYDVKVILSNGEEKISEEFYDKVIAFTFDDGPSKYTIDVMNTLISNGSKATFFELGNRMKYNQETVKSLYNGGMEVASHTYAHKNLNKLSEAEIDEEVNSTNIIFNEITGANIGLVRPPYGNANSKVKSRVLYPLILWDVDTEDWLYRDAEHTYNHILENAKDGDIILMHDIYPETLEAVKMVVPVLISRGYKITTVSELASIKGYNLEISTTYRYFK